MVNIGSQLDWIERHLEKIIKVYFRECPRGCFQKQSVCAPENWAGKTFTGWIWHHPINLKPGQRKEKAGERNVGMCTQDSLSRCVFSVAVVCEQQVPGFSAFECGLHQQVCRVSRPSLQDGSVASVPWFQGFQILRLSTLQIVHGTIQHLTS